MRRIIASYTRGGLTALYRQETGDGTVELLLLPAGREQETLRQDCAAAPLVQAKLAEDDSPAFFSGGRTLQSGPTTRALAFAGQQTRESAGRLTVTTTLRDPRGHRALAHQPGRPGQSAAEKRPRLLCAGRGGVVHPAPLRPAADPAGALPAGAGDRTAEDRVGGRLAPARQWNLSS